MAGTVLDDWPPYMALPSEFAIVAPTLTMRQGSRLPNFYSEPEVCEADELATSFSAPTTTLALPYPLCQFHDDDGLDERGRKIAAYVVALREEELRRRAALDALREEGVSLLDAAAGDRLRELGAPRACVAAHSAAETHRTEARANIRETLRDKELQSRDTEVVRLKLLDLTVAPYMEAKHPDRSFPIATYQGKRRHVPKRDERPRPDLAIVL